VLPIAKPLPYTKKKAKMNNSTICISIIRVVKGAITYMQGERNCSRKPLGANNPNKSEKL
jgi:hypothetical protein